MCCWTAKTRLHLKLCVWTTTGCRNAYSEIQCFTIGLMDPSLTRSRRHIHLLFVLPLSSTSELVCCLRSERTHLALRLPRTLNPTPTHRARLLSTTGCGYHCAEAMRIRETRSKLLLSLRDVVRLFERAVNSLKDISLDPPAISDRCDAHRAKTLGNLTLKC